MFDLIPTELVIACLWNLMFDSSIGSNMLISYKSSSSAYAHGCFFFLFWPFFSSNLGHWIQ